MLLQEQERAALCILIVVATSRWHMETFSRSCRQHLRRCGRYTVFPVAFIVSQVRC
eukprot:COSAG02_NODE_67058_length_254_cov_0.516129_1_plen_55_part_01